MKNWKIGLLAGFLLVVLAGNAFASPYEWLRSPWASTSGTFNANANNTNKIYWYPETSGNYYEYRALYLHDGDDWVRITECDHAGYINGKATDGCFNVPFWGWSAGTYTARATIQWSGCGSYTPTPNTATCGDYHQFSLTLT
ncbi:MAG: hypothetical protein ABII71_02050 [Candidatus Micrarchaeota archaeon]